MISYLIFSLVIDLGFAQVLSRFGQIQSLVHVEEEVVRLAKAEIERYEKELQALKDYVEDYEESTKRHLDGLKEKWIGWVGGLDENGEEIDEEMRKEMMKEEAYYKSYIVASNPLLIYRLGNRLTTKFTRLQRLLLRNNPDGVLLREILANYMDPKQENIEDYDTLIPNFGEHYMLLPTDMDVDEAVESLAFLYDTHEPLVTPEKFSSKFSPETTTPVEFNGEHSLKISLKSFYHGLYASAIDWVTYAEDLVADNSRRDYSISWDLAHYTKLFMIKTHNGDLNRPVNWTTRTYLSFFDTLVDIDPVKTVHIRSELQTRRESLLQSLYKNSDVCGPQKYNVSQLWALSNALCKGLNPLVPPKINENRKLKCFLDFGRHPTAVLNPLKVEEISKSPRIFHFYDVISGSQLEMMLYDISEMYLVPDLTRTFFPDSNGTRNAPNVTSVGTDIDRERVETLKIVKTKAEISTGLKLIEGDEGPFRVTEYVAGRYGALRKDIHNGEELAATEVDNTIWKEDDKISTILYFLTSPYEGGEIVFPTVGVKVIPTAGSVIYWENFGKNGEKRDDLWYMDCPLARGHKIVVSRHFNFNRHKDQFQCLR